MIKRGQIRQWIDAAAEKGTGTVTLAAAVLVLLIAWALLLRTEPLLEQHSWFELLTSTVWRPLRGEFGFLPFIAGTVAVTLLAMALATPPCLLCAIYLAEYAPTRLREGLKPVIDLLAGIPSVVYGVWGTLTVVPFIREFIAPWSRAGNPTGYGLLAGGIVLAVMVFPILISVTEEVLRAVPYGMREAALAMGATRWQMVKSVVLRRARPGVIAAIVLGFSRAFGETMAVMMVIGNVAQIPTSIFDAAYTLPALIANNYGEMMSIPLYDAALLAAALVLLLLVLGFTAGARIVLLQAVKSAA